MATAKHLVRYLAGTVDFATTYKQGGCILTAFSDANLGSNPDNGKIAFLANAPVSFKVGLQGLTSQSTMEAELVAAALAMKEAVFCSNIMKGWDSARASTAYHYISTTPRLSTSPDIGPTVRESST